jgi:hypothetical protein
VLLAPEMTWRLHDCVTEPTVVWLSANLPDCGIPEATTAETSMTRKTSEKQENE